MAVPPREGSVSWRLVAHGGRDMPSATGEVSKRAYAPSDSERFIKAKKGLFLAGSWSRGINQVEGWFLR